MAQLLQCAPHFVPISNDLLRLITITIRSTDLGLCLDGSFIYVCFQLLSFELNNKETRAYFSLGA